ncbi:hypothetical protein GCM10010259_61490 [Streptomyces daghestanicus]|uniref:Tyr recombinase domain-containing protein n=1 Tax=Streptomyces daghestanicus TaxID=66885 RepID=A0ABQ3Q7P7_9ACTN|nr:hypothetical protein GCM10010259_61490 [Streptomyces daghestanicus]GHI33303.1 hypothetical protein Sdagh_50330 [Streptomyces daghestanicus]
MLHETVARAEEILGVTSRSWTSPPEGVPVKAKGAAASHPTLRRPREDYVMEPVYWDAGTAGCCPSWSRAVYGGRCSSPTANRAPGKCQPARRVPGHRAGPAVVRAGPRPPGRAHGCRERGGKGLNLQEYRHSCFTHLGKAGARLPMLMAKTRHKKPKNVWRYFQPSAEAIAEVTSLLAPGDSRR